MNFFQSIFKNILKGQQQGPKPETQVTSAQGVPTTGSFLSSILSPRAERGMSSRIQRPDPGPGSVFDMLQRSARYRRSSGPASLLPFRLK